MDLDNYSEWRDALLRIAAEARTVVLVGATDTGKTTFCTLLTNEALARGRRVAILDGDLGQSEIGPPACIGLGFPSDPIRQLADVRPSAMTFVGSTAPRGSMVEQITGMRLLADEAARRGIDLLIVDTSGYIEGAGAGTLKEAKFALLRPDTVVAIQRSAECEPLLAPLRFRLDTRIDRLTVPSAIVRKPPGLRTQRRAGRLAKCFDGAEVRQYEFDDVVLLNTWLNCGPAIAPHLLTFIGNSMATRAYYAEVVDGHLGIVTSSLPAGDAWTAAVLHEFRAKSITITPASKLRHLLVGMEDGNGKLLGLGLIEALDLRRRRIGILTSTRAAAAVRVIRFGLLRMEASGKELGTNRPGDV